MNLDKKASKMIQAGVQTVKSMKTAGIPVVVVLYSARPITIDSVLDDAVVFVNLFM